MLKLITCIASEDKEKEVSQGLIEKFGLQTMVNHFARGFGRSSSMTTQKLGQQTEKVVISVMVQKKDVDAVFAYMFHTAALDRPHGGIIYVTAINKSIISPRIEDQDLGTSHENT